MPSFSHLFARVAALLPNGGRSFTREITEFLELIETLDADCDLCGSCHGLKAAIKGAHENDVMDRLVDAERVRRFGTRQLRLTESQVAGIVADAFFGVE